MGCFPFEILFTSEIWLLLAGIQRPKVKPSQSQFRALQTRIAFQILIWLAPNMLAPHFMTTHSQIESQLNPDIL